MRLVLKDTETLGGLGSAPPPRFPAWGEHDPKAPPPPPRWLGAVLLRGLRGEVLPQSQRPLSQWSICPDVQSGTRRLPDPSRTTVPSDAHTHQHPPTHNRAAAHTGETHTPLPTIVRPLGLNFLRGAHGRHGEGGQPGSRGGRALLGLRPPHLVPSSLVPPHLVLPHWYPITGTPSPGKPRHSKRL